MRLGGPVFEPYANPDEWVANLKKLGYSAAWCPLDDAHSNDDDMLRAYSLAAKSADIVIAEVGAWSNPLSTDDHTRQAAITLCQERLSLADRLGARCCVNIAGSRGAQWDGPHPDNLTADTFDLVVESVRLIIDAVKPQRTFYTLETMPWMYPDSPDSYAALIRAIDRPQFAAHFDPVNLICSPQRFYNNGILIRECFQKFGNAIQSCHAKDITLSGKLTVHLDEVRPGSGELDYRTLLRELSKIDPDVPLMMEHMAVAHDYAMAAVHIRSIASELGLAFR